MGPWNRTLAVACNRCHLACGRFESSSAACAGVEKRQHLSLARKFYCRASTLAGRASAQWRVKVVVEPSEKARCRAAAALIGGFTASAPVPVHLAPANSALLVTALSAAVAARRAPPRASASRARRGRRAAPRPPSPHSLRRSDARRRHRRR